MAAAFLPVLGSLAFAATAGADATPTFGAIAVDNARQHVFVSVPNGNAIDEFDFQGDLVNVIPNIYGADGMVVDGNTLYVAEGTAGEIVSLDLTDPTAAAQEVASGLNGPSTLALAGGVLWTALAADDGDWADSIVSVDPGTGAETALPLAVDYPAVFAGSGDPEDVYVVDSEDPTTIYRYDATTSPATQDADVWEENLAFADDLAVSPDGTRVIPAGGNPYDFAELDGSTLQPDGVTYPGSPYPAAVAVSTSGLLATGLRGYNSPDVSVYQLGIPQAIFNGETTALSDGEEDVLPDGLALSADGSELFAVAANPNGLEFDTFDVATSNTSGTDSPTPPTASTPLTGVSPVPTTPPVSTTPVSTNPTQLAAPLARLRRSAAHGRPTVTLTLGALRTPTVDKTTNKLTGYTYAFDATSIHCGGRASYVSISVAGSRRSIACRTGTFVVSRSVALGRTYRLSVTAIEVRGHHRKSGETRVLKLTIPRDGRWTAT